MKLRISTNNNSLRFLQKIRLPRVHSWLIRNGLDGFRAFRFSQLFFQYSIRQRPLYNLSFLLFSFVISVLSLCLEKLSDPAVMKHEGIDLITGGTHIINRQPVGKNPLWTQHAFFSFENFCLYLSFSESVRQTVCPYGSVYGLSSAVLHVFMRSPGFGHSHKSIRDH